MGIKTLFAIFELVSNNKLTSNIEISPHLIDFSRGSIYYTPSQMSHDELVPLVDSLRQNRYIKHFECPLYQIDTDDAVFCLQGMGNNRTKVTVEVVSSLRCFLECFSIKKLTLKKCEFTKESITDLCDLIRSNNSLTSVDFSDFKFVKLTQYGGYQMIGHFNAYDHYSNLINTIQCNSRLTTVTLSHRDIGIKTLLTIFELVSTNKLTSNIEISPHLIDFSRGSIYYDNCVEDDDLILLLNALKSNIPIKSVDCKESPSITLTGLIALFEILSFNKSVIDLGISPNLINVDNGVFCFNPKSWIDKPKITTNECTSLQNFLNCFNIKKLSFEGCLFSVKSFSLLCDSIKAHNSLTSVELWGCNLSDSGFMNVINALQFKSCFKIIDLDNSNVKPKSLFRCLDVILAGKLTPTIEVSNCGINVETKVFNLSFDSDTQVTADEVSFLQCFLQCFNMKKLVLKRCIFTNEASAILDDIIRTNQLTSVDFSYCYLCHFFDNFSRLSIVFSPSIIVVDLTCNLIGSEGTTCRALAEALKVNSRILQIDLSKNSICPEGARMLAEALKINSTIECIFLTENSIGTEGTRSLAEALKVNSTITHVYLEDNSIGPEGARALAEALKVNSTVAEIYLDENSIGPEGARALAEALKVNSTITHISLFANSIGPEGARAFAEALKVNSTTTDIYLGDNTIGPEGSRVLADALKFNSTVTDIYLGDNFIGPEGARALAEALKVNSTITGVYLGDNTIGPEGARALAEAQAEASKELFVFF
ncbi:hypothetical protein GEMRC1_013739 [Eukaryota sp. GEM-RC1]